jgi:hypothetical protein
MFWRNMSSPSSGLKDKPSKKPGEADGMMSSRKMGAENGKQLLFPGHLQTGSAKVINWPLFSTIHVEEYHLRRKYEVSCPCKEPCSFLSRTG